MACSFSAQGRLKVPTSEPEELTLVATAQEIARYRLATLAHQLDIAKSSVEHLVAQREQATEEAKAAGLSEIEIADLRSSPAYDAITWEAVAAPPEHE